MELKIEPTHRCNQKCRHCSSVGAYYDQDMTLTQFKNVAYQAWEYGFDSLVISGGEPLLWEPLFPALEYVKLLPYAKGDRIFGIEDDVTEAGLDIMLGKYRESQKK